MTIKKSFEEVFAILSLSYIRWGSMLVTLSIICIASIGTCAGLMVSEKNNKIREERMISQLESINKHLAELEKRNETTK